ncbi:PAS domain S-box protein [Caldimonas tepidiphila]|uniref:PAS domain S-box protein n=1 Tax=Caldimonas tepidiphila TaxID=2315841 RepID=UPI001473522A|nr:PAS domain S-box protein [Caldimonas tepidiphila]
MAAAARAIALLVSVYGLAALWLQVSGQAHWLAAAVPGAPPMRPASSVGLLLAGIAVATLGRAGRARFLSSSSGMALSALALLSLASGLGERAAPGTPVASHPIVALVFLLIAIAALGWKSAESRGKRFGVAAAVTGGALSLASVVPYALPWLDPGARLLLGVVPPQSAVPLAVLCGCIGLLCCSGTPAGLARRHAPLFTLTLGTSLVLIAAWSGILWANSAHVLREVTQRTEGVAHTLLEHMHRSLDPAALVLRQVADRISKEGLENFCASDAAWQELSSTAASLKQVNAILVLDRVGQVKFHSAQRSPRIPGKLSHRDYFAAHLRGEPTYLGPLIRVGSGKDGFTYSHRVTDEHGEFAGVVVASLELAYFQEFYGSLDLGHAGSIGVFRTDSRPLIRVPLPDDLSAVDMRGHPLFRDHVPRRDHGVFVARSPFDGQERFMAYRVSTTLPLVVSATASVAPLAAEFAEEAFAASLLLALALLALINGAAHRLRAALREEEHQRELEAGRTFARAILDSITAKVAITDRAGTILDVNEAWRRFARADGGTGEAIGSNYLRVSRHAGGRESGDRRAVAEGMEAVIRGEAERFEYNYECPSPTQDRWFKMRVTPLEGSDGVVVVSHEDVSDLKQAEIAVSRAKSELRKAHDALELRVAERTSRLQQALQRVTSLVEHSPLAVIEWDRELRVVRWSRRAEEMFGWRADEAMGRRLSERGLVFEDDREAMEAAMSQLVLGIEARNSGASRIYRKDGGLLHCEWHNSVLLDEQGQPVSVLSMVHDVSARRAAEAARRESEALFRDTFEQAAVGIAHVGLDGRWLRVNRRLCEIVGRSRQQLQQLTFADLTHPEDLQAGRGLAEELLQGRRSSYVMQKRYVRGDGSLVWVQLTVAMHRNEQGESLHFIAVVEDIQALKDAERALRLANDELEDRVASRTRELQASEQHIREIASTVPGVLFQWFCRQDGTTGFHYLSPRTQDLYGYAPEQVARDWAALLHPQDREATLKSTDRAVRDRAPWEHECRIVRAGGEVRVVSIIARPVRSDAEEIVYTGFLIDVTDARRAQQALSDNELRYQTLVEGSLQGILVQRVHRDCKVLFANEVAARIYGYGSAAELMAEPGARHLVPEDVREQAAPAWGRSRGGETGGIHAQLAALRRDGSPIWVEILGRRIDWQGEPALQMTIMDVTERHRLEAELKRQATIDSLTGLLTRRQFNVLAEQEMYRRQRNAQSLTTLMVDIDHFKRINDTFGHQAGDAVLEKVAQALKEVLRGNDVIGRFGGEEFVALLVDADETAALAVAARIRARLRELRVTCRGQDIEVTASIGISALRPEEPSIEPSLGRADQALYAAKSAGRDRAVLHGAPLPAPGHEGGGKRQDLEALS